MTSRERFIAALNRQPLTGRVPHFELVFFLTMEAFGRLHPSQRNFGQWDQMEEKERQLHLKDIADLHIQTAEYFEHSAIFVHNSGGINQIEDHLRILDYIREKSGDKYFLMKHGDATYSIPGGDKMLDFTYRMADEPEKMKEEAKTRVEKMLETAEIYRKHGALDGFALCSDYCFNDNPFLSPNQFSEFITPYLKKLIAGQKELGFYTIKHTDGNIMPILDQLLECEPHALHSLDPQAKVDMAEMKKIAGDKVCLIGNVNCSLMDSGTEEEVAESARYALKHGMPGGGYIFSTSNCVYTGMRLERYKLIHDIWKQEGNYPQ